MQMSDYDTANDDNISCFSPGMLGVMCSGGLVFSQCNGECGTCRDNQHTEVSEGRHIF